MKKKVGSPKGNKASRKPGGPAKRVKKSSKLMMFSISSDMDIKYWSEFVVYLNNNAGKTFSVKTEGVNWSIHF